MHAYAPRQEQLQHFLDAIPEYGECPLSANQIFKRQEKVRLPRVHVYARLVDLSRRGAIEEIKAGYMSYYRKRGQSPTLALATRRSYNSEQRNQFSLDRDVDPFLQKLAPLIEGKTVTLWMDDPPSSLRKKQRNPQTRRLVVLTPGTTLGMLRECVLVSVVGKGSCLVRLDAPTKTADLVLAGMPARLATELLRRLQHIHQGV